jgi:hypothetical protein
MRVDVEVWLFFQVFVSEERQEVPVLLVDGKLQEHLLDVCVDDLLVRAKTQKHAQH